MKKTTQKTAISGTSGFLGQHLEKHLQAHGHKIIALSRSDFLTDSKSLAEKLKGVSLVVHLAGAPIMKRWTKSYRVKILNSRILTTRRLVDAMRRMDKPPECFVCASAVGIYPNTGVHTDESSVVADGFTGHVCSKWENEARQAQAFCRSLMFRFGIILGNDGGALKQIMLPFRLGLGGRIGTGRQMMSWVHIDDALEAFRFALLHKELYGPVNITAPNPVTNSEFTKVLAKTVRRRAIFHVPSFMLRLVLGKAATVITDGQHAMPAKLQKLGFEFRYSGLESALHNLLG